jgi:anthranilate synthase component 1
VTSYPSRSEFRALARSHSVVPIWREVLADFTTPVAAFARLARDDDHAFLFESVERERWSRWSFVGRRPSATVVARDGVIEVTGSLPASVPTDRGVLALLEALLAAYRSPSLPDLPPLHGGVVGYLGYDVVREVERLPDVPPDDHGLPDAVLSVIGDLAAYDHWRQRVTLVSNVVVGEGWDDAALDAAYDDAVGRVDRLAEDGARPLAEPVLEPPDLDDPLPKVTRTVSPDMYARAVAVAKEHILAGDIFQVVLSQRFDLDLDADPFDLYRSLRQVNPSPYMYFVTGTDGAAPRRTGHLAPDRRDPPPRPHR